MSEWCVFDSALFGSDTNPNSIFHLVLSLNKSRVYEIFLSLAPFEGVIR